MFIRNIGQIFATAIALSAVCASVYAEQTVYKWVGEDGVDCGECWWMRDEGDTGEWGVGVEEGG